MFDIITLGSATLDILVKSKGEIRAHTENHHKHIDIAYHLGSKILIEDVEFNSGGGGTNTAVAFSRLGLKTAFLGVLGLDVNGEFVALELRRENVEFLGKAKQGKTGLSIILPGKNDRTILAFKGVNDLLYWHDIHLPLETKWLYVSSMLGESFSTAEKLIEYAKQYGTKIAFNPSLYLVKQGIPKLKKLINASDILIMNKEEAQALTKERQIRRILNKLSELTNGIIVITNGNKEIFAKISNQIYKKRPRKIKVVDATGAGDAFASGFVYGIMKGKGVETALEYGCREAEAVLGVIGAKNNLLRKL